MNYDMFIHCILVTKLLFQNISTEISHISYIISLWQIKSRHVSIHCSEVWLNWTELYLSMVLLRPYTDGWHQSIIYKHGEDNVIFHKYMYCMGSAVAQWWRSWLETEGPRVWASPASLCCGPWARHIYPSLAGMRKFRIDQDFLIEHWHMIYIMPVVFAEIYFWTKLNSFLDIN